MPEHEQIPTDSATAGIEGRLETNLSGKSPQDLQEFTVKLEALRKSNLRALALSRALTFLLLVIALAAPSFFLLEASGSVEWEGKKVVMAVIGGIMSLLAAVRIHEFIDDRQRRLSIRKLRISEKEFFERVMRDFSSRLTEKVR